MAAVAHRARRAVVDAAPVRRSPRLLTRSTTTSSAPSSAVGDDHPNADELPPPPPAKRQRRRAAPKSKLAGGNDDANTEAETPALAENGGITFKHGTLSRRFEAAKLASGAFRCVVGCDEAGRGPLAGPVVAAACHIPLDVTIPGVHDSKKLSEPQREALFERLTTHPEIHYAVHINSPQRIDEINILQASLEAMTKAVEALPVRADFVFVDGNRLPPTLAIPAEPVIQGDGKVYAIAAASIIAKVTRDRLMVALDAQYPQYDLKQHKGYPTRAHMAAIARHGACPAIHRMTFAPLKNMVATETTTETKPKAKAKAKAKKGTTTEPQEEEAAAPVLTTTRGRGLRRGPA